MAYYSGVANDMAAVRQALIDACVGEGWVWNSANDVLHKNSVYIRLTLISGRLQILGRTSLTAGDAPGVVQVGTFKVSGSNAMAFPVSYDLFVFSNEVYCVLNYGVEFYQWLAFGKSIIDLPGSGCWFAATGYGGGSNYPSGVSIHPSGQLLINQITPGIFWGDGNSAFNYFIHSNLDGGEWSGSAISANQSPRSAAVALQPLIEIQPNSWNSEAVLLPVRAFKKRLEGKVSLIADLENIRITRCDNYQEGQIITIGDQRWKIYPCYRKNAVVRNGGAGLNHSGTFAHAIRYEGP